MGNWIDFLWLLFLVAVGSWAAGMLVTRAITPWLLGRPAHWIRRETQCLTLASAPLLVMLWSVFSVVLLAAAKQAGWIADHCLYHEGVAHLHLCLEHVPALNLTALHGVVAFGALAVPVVGGARLLYREQELAQRLTLLRRVGHGVVQRVPALRPMACAGGIRKPVIVLSRTLLDGLAPRQRRVVLAHEAAHLRHGDPKRSLALELLLLFHAPGSARLIRKSWSQALEERADDITAQRFGRHFVARTLLDVYRLGARAPRGSWSVAGTGLQRRIERLLQTRQEPGPGTRRDEVTGWLYGAMLALLPVLLITYHHSLETALSHVPGM
ncbi:MAG: M56 family metallopeptidase [Pseudohongiellaceae bacterium]